MKMFDVLGFEWDRSRLPKAVPTYSVERACFRFAKMMPEFVWDASFLEGNPFTFVEVKTLMDGVTVGGKKLSDQDQVLNLIESSKALLEKVKNKTFNFDKKTFCELNGLVARKEALEWGIFRGEGLEVNFSPAVSLGEKGSHSPEPTMPGAPRLNRIFADGIDALGNNCEPFERALAFFLFGALQQFFFDGNKRTSRMIMNGILMSEGLDAISVPAARAKEFNQKMVDFYISKNATEMMSFLISCYPDEKLMVFSKPCHRMNNI